MSAILLRKRPLPIASRSLERRHRYRRHNLTLGIQRAIPGRRRNDYAVITSSELGTLTPTGSHWRWMPKLLVVTVLLAGLLAALERTHRSLEAAPSAYAMYQWTGFHRTRILPTPTANE
jgi:hypothetical protein